VAYLTGDYGRAWEWIDRCLAADPRYPAPLQTAYGLAMETGDWSGAQPYEDRLLDILRSPEQGWAYRMAAARAFAWASYLAGREIHLDLTEEVALRVASDTAVHWMYCEGAAITLARLAIIRGDVAQAQQQYCALQGSPQEPNVQLDLLGTLAAVMGRYTEAEAHFERALAFDRKAGFGPDLARTCWEYGEMLLRRDACGDRARAAAVLDEGWAIARDLGLVTLLGRLEEQRRRLAERGSTASERVRPAAPARSPR